MSVGELFIIGFHGKVIPPWLKDFAARFGLGGVILFDYSCRSSEYDNNIASPAQVQSLCAEIATLPTNPLVFIDQEGGLVRRLKDGLGFQPLPSAKDFNRLATGGKEAILAASYGELRRLGFRYNFAPVIDVDDNPDNPNIGRIKRSYSADIGEVEANARLVDAAARRARVGLCLKHFPGIGGAKVDSHLDFMNLSDALRPEQEELFYTLAPQTFGDAVLVSHAIVPHWDEDRPMTLSPAGIGRLRRRLPETLLISDDMQMQGLQKALGTAAASLQAIGAGIDMVCIGNNLIDQEQEMAGLADAVVRRLEAGGLDQASVGQSIERVRKRKTLLG